MDDLFGFYEKKAQEATGRKKTPAKKAVKQATKKTKTSKTATPKKVPAKAATTKKAATKKATPKKAASKKTATKKAAPKKAAPKQGAAKKPAIEKTTAKKATPKRAPRKKPTAKKPTTKPVAPEPVTEPVVPEPVVVPDPVVPEPEPKPEPKPEPTPEPKPEPTPEPKPEPEPDPEPEPVVPEPVSEDLYPDFSKPGSRYRATPFWAWNCELDAAQLCRQIEGLKRMGMGGFHMHPRTGLATEYLGDDYMACVKACVEKAREEEMLAWLYDEDRWPSGFGGGFVTQDPALRMCSLRFTPEPYSAADPNVSAKPVERANTVRGDGVLLARYRVVLSDGLLVSFERLDEADTSSGPDIWYAYKEISPDSSWFNNQAYVDTLNPKAIERFRDVTHARYAEVVGEAFGTTIPAIFTDEPQVVHQKMLPRGDAHEDCVIAYTHDLDESYRAAWGDSLLDHLPELFWECADGTLPPVRWRYRDHVSERFSSAFSDTLGGWCEAHGIALTGHMMEEPTLRSQTNSIMEAMRHYRSFQLPGVDMLCDSVELTTVKQAASAAHQYGREGVLSELYGVTNWDFPFEGHKRQGDWQAALGVTVRVPHLTWVSMKGNAKRDYPASIGYQAPWCDAYPLIEDHFARVNYLLTQGVPLVRVAVIHPVESYWLSCGPRDRCGEELDRQDARFQQMASDLLYGGIDFDYVCEALLPTQSADGASGQFHVGQMSYDVVVVPALRTIRSTTLDRLEAFLDTGGEVLLAGRIPDHVDGEPSERAAGLVARTRCRQVDLLPGQLLEALEPVRELRVETSDGESVAGVLHQFRRDGERRHFFVCCNAKEPRDEAQTPCTVRVAGVWHVVLNDTERGTRDPLPGVRYESGATLIPWRAYAAASLLVTLEPCKTAELPVSDSHLEQFWQEVAPLPSPVPVTLSEPNVLLLDMAEYRVGDGRWSHREEIQRAENEIRESLGWAKKTGQIAQPWCVTPSGETAMVSFRFFIESDVRIEGASLALEDARLASIMLDGESVASDPDGWWTDEAIETVPMPVIEPGRRELVVTMPMTPEGSLEWLYLLGDFGVILSERRAFLVAPVRELAWGDWCSQGLPFYAGNVTYRCRVDVPGGIRCALRLPDFAAPLVAIHLDGEGCGPVAFDPYRLVLPELSDGEHEFALTAYGSRVNAFGAVHNCAADFTWWGPPAWETTGDRWTYDYVLRATGILTAPLVDTCT